jgi:hypothetical protein
MGRSAYEGCIIKIRPNFGCLCESLSIRMYGVIDIDCSGQLRRILNNIRLRIVLANHLRNYPLGYLR